MRWTCKKPTCKFRHGGSWVEPLPITKKEWQVRHWTSPVISVSHASLFVGLVLAWTTSPPALLEREKKEERKRIRFTSIYIILFRCYTHTHTRPEPGQPWKARGRKKRTQTTGNRPKQRRGGKGTNGPPEPTITNLRGETGLTKNRAHT